jgi:hypothetical protein
MMSDFFMRWLLTSIPGENSDVAHARQPAREDDTRSSEGLRAPGPQTANSYYRLPRFRF